MQNHVSVPYFKAKNLSWIFLISIFCWWKQFDQEHISKLITILIILICDSLLLAIAIWKLFHGNTVCATIASYICHPDELRLSLHLLTQFSQFSKLKLWLRFIFFVKFSFHGGSCNKEAPEITHTCCPQSWFWCIIASKMFQKLIWALLRHHSTFGAKTFLGHIDSL